jgi:hypothetical protein
MFKLNVFMILALLSAGVVHADEDQTVNSIEAFASFARPGGFRPGPGPIGRPGPRPMPGPIGRPGRPIGRPGPGYPGPRPGFHEGWNYDHGWHPIWWRPGFRFAPFVWIVGVEPGYFQCTAFNGNMQAFSDVGITSNEAAYNALYDCGGTDPAAAGCYIPPGYCNLR